MATLVAPELVRSDPRLAKRIDVVLFASPRVAYQDVYRELKFENQPVRYSVISDPVVSVGPKPPYSDLPGRLVDLHNPVSPTVEIGPKIPLASIPAQKMAKGYEDHVPSTYEREMGLVCDANAEACKGLVNRLSRDMTLGTESVTAHSAALRVCNEQGMDANLVGRALFATESDRKAYLTRLYKRYRQREPAPEDFSAWLPVIEGQGPDYVHSRVEQEGKDKIISDTQYARLQKMNVDYKKNIQRGAPPPPTTGRPAVAKDFTPAEDNEYRQFKTEVDPPTRADYGISPQP